MATNNNPVTRDAMGAKVFTSTNAQLLPSSGTCDATTTTWWKNHIQTVEMMYTRKTQYDPTTGGAEFNYLDINFTCGTEDEHWYGNASTCDFLQYQSLSLISDSASGGFGLSGALRTVNAGVYRREVMTGDVEDITSINGNITGGKLPGVFVLDGGFDSSDTTPGTVADLLLKIQTRAPEFEMWMVNL
mgnify:CR=1 FL=1